jgi:hypothetical protein
MIGFASPWLLLALLGLPLLWWLLRAVPPRPRREVFPPFVLLQRLRTSEQTPAHTPWWILVLRLVLMALVIVFCAGPVWQPTDNLFADKTKPLLIMVDNGWSSGQSFEAIRQETLFTLDQAAQSDRLVMLWPLAEPSPALTPVTAARAKEIMLAMAPLPLPLPSQAITEHFSTLMGEQDVQPVLLGDGVMSRQLADTLLALTRQAGQTPLWLLQEPDRLLTLKKHEQSRTLTFELTPLIRDQDQPASIQLFDNQNNILAQQSVTLSEDPQKVSFDLPLPLVQDAAYASIAGQSHAGAMALIDARSKRKTIALISGEKATQNQSLLRETHYLTRAFSPYSEITVYDEQAIQDGVLQALETNPSLIVLVSVGRLLPEARQALENWVNKGGMLLRFASPELSLADNPLVPVRLRQGRRELGGTLSWQTPQGLGFITEASPFTGLDVSEEISISQQILADPAALTPEQVWVELRDGTPLVTARAMGRGEVILFHVPARPGWSNLPLSGLFEAMMGRLVQRAPLFVAANAPLQGDASEQSGDAEQSYKPLRLLSGTGQWTLPDERHYALTGAQAAKPTVSYHHPPGFYGKADAPLALNLALAPHIEAAGPEASSDNGSASDLISLTQNPLPDMHITAFRHAQPVELRPYILGLVIALLLADSLVMLWLSGLLPFLSRSRPALRKGLSCFVFLLLISALVSASLSYGVAHAQDRSGESLDFSNPDDFALYVSEQTRLAYVITGQSDIDRISQQGLKGLSLVLAERTALEPGEPVGVDLSRDDISLFPLLYWPMTNDIAARLAGDKTAILNKLDHYMQHGGTILFDTRDATNAAQLFSGQLSPQTAQLRLVLEGLDIPLLEPVPDDHVLGKTFYLLESFPGRTATGPLWVERQNAAQSDSSRPVRQNDGVSSILITSNDMAAAWALDENGLPLLPTLPPDPFQREWAYRAGINIVMYVLTGNYKADQVHVPALLERLGQ